MSAGTLDQLVKGAPAQNAQTEAMSEMASGGAGGVLRSSPDPTTLIPGSPPQIYLNLLILEASLRQQYLTLRARKRQHTLVVAGLGLWILGTFYLQFLRPREDGSGIGGSVYWLVDMAEKVSLTGGVVMGVLFWASGQWERGMRWPRKWLGTTNRGLRTTNCKIVILKGPWWKELFSHLSFLSPLQPSTPGSSYQYIDLPMHEKRALHANGRQRPEEQEEDVAPGGDHVKVLLLPKLFTADFRENWEIYRAEYWDAENTRRAELRRQIAARNRELARQQGGWLWWTGWRGWACVWGLSGPPRPAAREVTPPPHHVHSVAHQQAMQKHRRRPSAVKERDGSHSRSSSRSSTITSPDSEIRERRWSTASSGSTGGRRRSRLIEGEFASARSGNATTRSPPVRLLSSGSGAGSKGSSRPSTPNAELKTRGSNLSAASSASGDAEARGYASAARTTPEVAIKAEPGD